MKLSILIPSLFSRSAQLQSLLAHLSSQCAAGVSPDVEILVRIDGGEKTTGRKRNELMAAATGEYVVFIDDDDVIAPNYISSIMEGIGTRADIVSISGYYIPKNDATKEFHDSIYYHWEFKDNVHLRSFQHIDAIKSSIAKQFLFPDISLGEDREWSSQLRDSGLIKTEYKTRPIYFYLYSK
jgi:glycosyltransferase involved in cell wall biosynthesis